MKPTREKNRRNANAAKKLPADFEIRLSKVRELARRKGVQVSYDSAFGTRLDSSVEGLIAVLRELGTELKPDLSNVDRAMKADEVSSRRFFAEPVSVFWNGGPGRIALNTEGLPKTDRVTLNLKLEDGGVREFSSLVSDLSDSCLVVHEKLPFGYHQGVLQAGKAKRKLLVISSPEKAYQPSGADDRVLGVFAPLYGIHSKASWGIGDLTDLRKLMDWSYAQGCRFVGTLPMLAIFNDKPIVEPSPYAPLSRLFWNELYIDPRAADEWNASPRARKVSESAAFRKKLAGLQRQKQVDYQAVARLKRPVFEALAETFFEKGGDRSKAYREFLKVYPMVEDYAEFRATGEKRNASWRKWPERMRNGTLRKGDFHEKDKRTHVYTQWLAHNQLSSLCTDSKKQGLGIYIDFPLSAHADGYDVWRERESFAQTVSAGCPPDPNHVHGQDWGILALNPKVARETGYRYVRRCLDGHMRYAGLLRLDHVMAFFRLYWVPHGLGAKNGVYVRYQMEELFAILILESHRNQCLLIGEDLGTVPQEIRDAMTRHGVLRMWVQQRRLGTGSADEPLPPPPADCICSLNTHDMPPFAAFWKGLDIIDKQKLGYFGKKELPEKQKARTANTTALVQMLVKNGFLKSATDDLSKILRAILELTASNPVRVMQINLEDLWLETLPQNTPGTWKERPNWQRKLRHSIEKIATHPGLPELFQDLIKRRSTS